MPVRFARTRPAVVKLDDPRTDPETDRFASGSLLVVRSLLTGSPRD